MLKTLCTTGFVSLVLCAAACDTGDLADSTTAPRGDIENDRGAATVDPADLSPSSGGGVIDRGDVDDPMPAALSSGGEPEVALSELDLAPAESSTDDSSLIIRRTWFCNSQYVGFYGWGFYYGYGPSLDIARSYALYFCTQDHYFDPLNCVVTSCHLR